MRGAHRKKAPEDRHKVSGRHRKPNPLSFTWRTTGSVIVGAVVLGTAAVTAHASVLPFGSAAAPSAAGATTAGKAGKDPDKDSRGGPGKSRSKNSSGAGPGRTSKAAPKEGAKDGPERTDPAQTGDARTGGTRTGDARPTADEAIKIAKSQVGVREDGGGGTKFHRWYMSTARAKETAARNGGSISAYSNAQWCDMFISWVGAQIGFSDQIGSDAWTVAHARWFQQQGRWGTEPKPGAVVFYAWDGSKDVTDIRHVGLVVRKVDGGTIEAVEGNTGNAVRIRKRSTDDVVGYGYPDYRP